MLRLTLVLCLAGFVAGCWTGYSTTFDKPNIEYAKRKVVKP